MSRTVQLFAVTALLMLASCGDGPETQVEGGSDAMFMAEIARTYGFKCALCHGKNGTSIIKTAPNLKDTKMTIEERVAIIKYGKTTMPPQKDVLDKKTIRGLAEYIDTFQ